MRPHEINSKNNFICGWYMDDTTFCDSTINYFHNAPDRRIGAVNRENDKGIIDKTIKSCEQAELNNNRYLLTDYLQHLQQVINLYGEKYKYAVSQGTFRNMEPIGIQHYNPSDAYYSWHCERSNHIEPMCHRHLVFMTYLNDVTDEGETEFYHQNIKVKPEKGLTLMWGSDWTFTHRGIPSPSQHKYILTGCLHFV